MIDAVRARVKGLSDRGVFQGWSESPGRAGKTTFRFRWLLGAEFDLAVDPEKREVVVRDVLPSIEHRSFLDSDLRRFVAGRADKALPEHRRVDPARAKLNYRNRRGAASLVLEVAEGDTDYALKALFTVLNDLFAHLHLNHIDYLHRNFAVPEE